MTTTLNNNNNNIDDCGIPGFQIMCLTPEEDDYQYDDDYYNQEEDICTWLDDCESQENLATILPLNPEECIIDKENHIKSMTCYQLFFEELGVLTEEPEPIDPTRNYELEAQILIEERNKTRKKHIDLSPMPSLDNSSSGVSSTSSSFHGTDESPTMMDIRSPLCMSSQMKMTAYAYAPHVFSPIRTPI